MLEAEAHMRLGAPVFDRTDTPERWIEAVQRNGYRAAYCPATLGTDDLQVDQYAAAAREADIVIAEVGSWCNPLSPDRDEADAAFTKCIDSLRLADRIGARCCVNIAGNLGDGPWDGADAANLAPAAFDRVVESVQTIIDRAEPERADYCLEPMPWMLPHSADAYLSLIEAVDRERFAVHFDPVNLLNSVEKHFAHGALIDDFVTRLGGMIRSAHAKDQRIGTSLTLRLDEAEPGTGNLDFDAYLSALDRLDPDLPLMVEHLDSEEAYRRAVAFIRERARALSISV